MYIGLPNDPMFSGGYLQPMIFLNSENWEIFANGRSGQYEINGAFAIATPTPELWVASWNKVNKSYKILANGDNDSYGYSYNGKNRLDLTQVVSSGSYSDLFFCAKDGDYYAYWLAGPGSSASNCICCVNDTCSQSALSYGFTGGELAVRPVVCLPPTVKLVLNSETGKYDILKK